MPNLFSGLRELFIRVPDAVRKRKGLMWGILLVLTIALAAGIGRMKMDASMISYFDKKDPVRQAYDRFRATFGGDETLYVVYEAKDGDVFSKQSLEAIQGIQDELMNHRVANIGDGPSPLDPITDVTSIVNASYLEARGDALISRDFIGERIPGTPEAREALRQQALNEENYRKVYFSDDFRYGGLVIETNYNAVPIEDKNPPRGGGLDDEAEIVQPATGDMTESQPLKFKETLMPEYVPFMHAVSAIFQKPEYARALTFHPVGTPAFMAFAVEMIMSEMGMIALGSLLLIVIVTWLLFRSFSSVLWSSGIVIVSLVWVMGTIGWSGLVISDLISIIVFFVLAVGVADAIHILSGYVFFRNQGNGHEETLRLVYKKSAMACFLTSATTAAGFASFAFVPIAAIQKIGLFAALGVMYAFVITLFYLPLMLDLWSPVSKRRLREIEQQPGQMHLLQKVLRRIETLSLTRKKWIILTAVVFAVTLFFGIPKIRVASSTIDILRKGLPIRQDFKLADRCMGGTDNLEILIDSGQRDGLKDPAMLQSIDRLQTYLEERFAGYITNTFSLADVTKESYQALRGGDKKWYVIPRDRHTLEQTLFLFDSANVSDRRELVTDDYQMGRVSIRAKTLGSQKSMELMKAVDDYVAGHMAELGRRLPGLQVTLTGQVAMRMRMFNYISWSQIISFSIALGVISLFLLFVLGSKRIGLIAIIPNLMPLVAAAGMMGYFKIPLDVHTIMVLPIVIGISVDDTIHFLTHFRIEMQTHGDPKKAVIQSFREVGQAIVFTSLVLSIGFLVFVLSKNQGFVYFGVINAVAIITAVIADLVLLPALLLVFFRQQEQLKPAHASRT